MEVTDLAAHFSRAVVALMCATVRIQVALAIVPLFNRQLVPGLLRAGIGVSLSLPLLPPLFLELSHGAPPAFELTTVVLKEAFLGLLLGYAVATVFWAAEAVGFFIDNQRGASIASTLNPLTGNDSAPLGILFNQAFAVYFLVAGGFGVFMTLVYASYGLWPVMHFLPGLPPDGITVFAGLFARVAYLAVLLSAPVIVAMMLAELGLALVSRFAPQLQVFVLAMPVKCGLAFFVLVVYLPLLFDHLSEQIRELPQLLTSLAAALN